jgi:hypothetical protein
VVYTSAPTAGYKTIEDEFEASLRRAFLGDRLSPGAFIVVYDRRQTFRLEGMGYGEAMGWLRVELVELDEQSSEYCGYLTEAGRTHFSQPKTAESVVVQRNPDFMDRLQGSVM